MEKSTRYLPSRLLRLFLLLTILFPVPAALAAKTPLAKGKTKAAPAHAISFDYSVAADGHNEFLVLGDAPMKNYTTFLLANPSRLVLDIPGVDLQGNRVEIPVKGPEIDRIRIARHPNKVRFVFDLVEGKNVRHKVIELDKGLTVLLSLDQDQSPLQIAAATPNTPEAVEKEPPVSQAMRPRFLASADLEKIFGSQQVSVIFHKTPIREFAKYLSEKSGHRIEVNPQLATAVSLRLTEVPLHTLVSAAADTIGFILRQEGERIILDPADPSPPALL